MNKDWLDPPYFSHPNEGYNTEPMSTTNPHTKTRDDHQYFNNEEWNILSNLFDAQECNTEPQNKEDNTASDTETTSDTGTTAPAVSSMSTDPANNHLPNLPGGEQATTPNQTPQKVTVPPDPKISTIPTNDGGTASPPVPTAAGQTSKNPTPPTVPNNLPTAPPKVLLDEKQQHFNNEEWINLSSPFNI